MQRADQLIIERPIVERPSALRPDQIKSILFHVHEDEGLDDRLQAALSLTRACSAHLELIQIIPIEAYTLVDAYASYVSGEIVQALEEDAAKVRARLEAQLSKEDVSWSFEVTTSSFIPALVRNAALADLLFIDRQPPTYELGRSALSLLGELVCGARTPLCLPGDRSAGLGPFGTAVIAWNNSVEAASAVRGSVGMLRMASQVRVVRYIEDKDQTFPDTRLLEYLSRHSISAELDIRSATNDFADDLVEYALVNRAEYVVMGGYSHSRAGEFLFGGVTRALLRACPVTLIIAH
jgi:nucleotide-binding universal stress UspA family protein